MPTSAMMLKQFGAGGGGGFGGLAAGTYYITRTIDHTKLASEDRTDDLVFVVDATFTAMKSVGNGGHVNHADGADIHVTSSDGNTEWTFYLENYDPTTGAIVLWIKPPSTTSSSSDRTFLIAYGDSSISSTLGSKTNTFPASIFDFAHGLGDNGSGGVVVTDRSANGLNATNNNGATLDTTSGLINGGAAFARASSQYFSIAYNSVLNQGAQSILAVIITGSSFPAFMAIYERQTTGGMWWGLAVRSDAKLHHYVNMGIGNSDAIGATALSASTRYVVGATTTPGTNTDIVYLNGSSDGAVNGVNQFSGGDTSSGSNIGGNPFNSGRYFNGSVGECWLLNGAMSAGWMGAHSNALKTPSTFSTGTTETAI